MINLEREVSGPGLVPVPARTFRRVAARGLDRYPADEREALGYYALGALALALDF
jgi:hypothetical protein